MNYFIYYSFFILIINTLISTRSNSSKQDVQLDSILKHSRQG
jgi:hypothetical protein